MLVGSIGHGIISFFLNSYYTGKTLQYSSWMQLRDIAPSYAVAFTIGITVYFLKLLPISYFIILPIQVLVGAGVGFAVCELFKPSEYIDLKSIIQEKIKIFRKH